jgi:hypothetical protein
MLMFSDIRKPGQDIRTNLYHDHNKMRAAAGGREGGKTPRYRNRGSRAFEHETF